MSNPQNPEWLEATNREGESFDLPSVVPLDFDSLVNAAKAKAGLDDFGEDYWQAPLKMLCDDLNSVAELTLFGRLMARNDLLIWLNQRLEITELTKRHPEILQQAIVAPMFIVGLPRSGTSILFEVLAQDPDVGVPKMWESMLPTPPPETATYSTDKRIEHAHQLFTQWNRAVPEFATVHEMAGDIPAECGLIMAGSFISDHIASLHMSDNYGAWHAQADLTPAYQWHKIMLQVLQWKNPRKRWLLKAPAHQSKLDTLLKIYPDARIIQTHRDPIQCMGSATNLMACLYKMRSNKPFNAAAFDEFLVGEATAQRLELVIDQVASGVVPKQSLCDSRYCDLMDQPIECVEHIYRYFDMPLTEATKQRILDYLAAKPKGKFGAHNYQSDATERHYFERYQQHYQVPSEV